MSTPTRWISSDEAIGRLRSVGIGERTLREWLAQGLVTGRARLTVDRRERRENVTIDRDLWRQLLDDPLTRCDWVAGTVSLVRLNGNPHRDFKLFGLAIGEQGIADMAPLLSQPGKPAAGGAPKQIEAWTAFWLALLQIAQEGRLNTTAFQTQAALRSELLLMIGDALSDRTIKPVVSQVWRRLVAPPSQK